MKGYSFMFVLIVLFCTLLLASCSTVEKGEISFDTPGPNSMFHDSNNGALSKTVSIKSTFASAKEARLYVDGQGPISCWLAANISTDCSIVLGAPGTHPIRVDVDKQNGNNVEVVSIEGSAQWTPYSPLDLGMQKISGLVGQEDPIWGYNMVAALISGIIAIFAMKVAGKGGAIVVFIIMAFGFAYFAPVEIVSLMVKSLYGLAGGYIAILIIKMITDTYKHLAFVKKGNFIGAYAGEGGPNAIPVLRGFADISAQGQGTFPQTPQSPYLPGSRGVPQISPGEYYDPQDPR